MGSSKSSAKHEYDKPRLKQQIDRAMAQFIGAGHKVQHVPSIVAPELPPAVRIQGKLDEVS